MRRRGVGAGAVRGAEGCRGPVAGVGQVAVGSAQTDREEWLVGLEVMVAVRLSAEGRLELRVGTEPGGGRWGLWGTVAERGGKGANPCGGGHGWP